nr:GNAT family N-acetyltransferase [uncultured Oscillibacter sp.]
MKIVPYEPKYRQDFIDLNKLWISEMFTIEPEDLAVLEGIEASLAQGAQIFFAVDDDGGVLACCMIAPLPNGEWEIEKFCARGMSTGTGAGAACLKACLDYARERRVEKIVIVSNRKCVQAVHLYRKFGFVEVPVDREKFPFDRADIAFEQVFHHE